MTAMNGFEKRIESITDNGMRASGIETIQVNPNVAKVEDAADPRRQG